jgi:ferredoxin-NADP reductase
MAELKTGTVVRTQKLSSILGIFSVMPENGGRFPSYEAGQYIALRRNNCKLTKKAAGPDGQPSYVPDVDQSGNPKIGGVTHSYSIASAPFETEQHGHLEFYVVLEKDEHGTPGRLSPSLLELDPGGDDKVLYVNRITGHFTLAKTAAGFGSVLFVGTGTGLAPFIAMIKQLHFEAGQGRGASGMKYTLLHTNRTIEEMAYHQELLDIEKSGLLDFVYVSSVSRPTQRDFDDPVLGRGRANNVLRYMFDMPLKEEDELQAKLAGGEDASKAKAALDKTTRPALPRNLSRSDLQKRFDPARTVILTCGNPSSMADIKYVADTNQIRFEKEDW